MQVCQRNCVHKSGRRMAVWAVGGELVKWCELLIVDGGFQTVECRSVGAGGAEEESGSVDCRVLAAVSCGKYKQVRYLQT
jgi:hypothetical protein